MLKKSFGIAIAGCLCFVAAGGATPQPRMKKIIDDALVRSARQSMRLYEDMKGLEGQLPQTAEDGKLIASTSRRWTSGFFPGTLWYLYESGGDPAVRQAAEAMTERVMGEQFSTATHDVGFQINCSAGNGYRLTGREAYREALINAGRSLATRFDETVGATKSWDKHRFPYPVIIDNMMNLELLTVSSSLTGDNTHYDMAKSHADRTLENHMRSDGSSYHVVGYDTETGAVTGRITHQGLSDESTWARGQAWAIYGFTMMYRQTGHRAYLDQAVKAGRFVMHHPRLPKDKIPYWDFDSPKIPNEIRDASAGALMASAFIELSTYLDGRDGDDFLRLAEAQIRSLASASYMAAEGRNNHFILMHSTGHMPKNSEVDQPLSYADYYFVEALIRYGRLLDGRPVVDTRTAFSELPDRALWLSAMDRIGRPLLWNMSRGELKKNMPVESSSTDLASRRKVTHLEAIGRLLCGIAPWLELGPDQTPEGRLRAEYTDMAIRAISHGVDPDSPDYLNFNREKQPLVDAAFLGHALLRAPVGLWGNLDGLTRERLITEMKSSRAIKPYESNWLLFSAMVECFLKEYAGEWEYDRVKYALDKHQEWYKGDGWYGDGANFHLDYYNSFVIQPMMTAVLETAKKHGVEGIDRLLDVQRERYARYAVQQERLISPEGTYPAVGRSLVYRFGAFQTLSDVAYRGMLPAKIVPAQVRCALTEVIRRQTDAPGTFDEYGWLRVGFSGHQPDMGETYISTGSLYLCAAGLIALGLPSTDEFWRSPAALWTNQKAWNGIGVGLDKALNK